ncbi:phosphoribosylformylglycinamidine synthase I, partial [Shinella sp.]
MKSAVVQLPGLNRDRDMIAALTKISGVAPVTVWQTETDLPDVDLIVIPGGFSYGDYLRCGAIAARMPVMQAIKAKAEAGVKVLGVCNGFQILLEAGLLPGALMRNASLKFVCREVKLEVVNAETDFTRAY